MAVKFKTEEGDRRTQKTRKLLSEAFRTLMAEKSYEAITVQEIIDRANVGRSTFYSHYESKEHLLVGQEPIERLLIELGKRDIDSSGQARINLLALYQHVKDHAGLAKAAMGKESGNIILKCFRDNLYFRIVEQYEGLYSGKPTEHTMFLLTAEAAASAMIRLLESWIDKNMPFPPEEMSCRSQQLLDRLLSSQTVRFPNTAC